MMGRVYDFLGLNSGVILNGISTEQRKQAYNSDITYGTNSEFGFDYLRDNMVGSIEERVQRELNYCIVDEVDSILIDEARTPLIISGAATESIKWYKVFYQIVSMLSRSYETEGIKDVKAKKLLDEYDRVILCCGASNPRDIKVKGREAKGIYFAVDFLKSTTKALLDNGLKDGTYISAKGKNVMVIGGGDTGNDCVGTSIRHGAKSVLQLEMMPKLPDKRTADNPWPQWPRVCKTDYGQEEAIEVFGHDPRVYQTTVKEFISDDKGNLKGAVLVKLKPEKDEKTGRLMMKEVEGSEYTVDVELVLIAAGFLGSESYVTKAFGVEVNARTNVATAEGSHATNVKNVFTAGDMHRGQSLVVWAIREGRDVAKEVDLSLIGYTNL